VDRTRLTAMEPNARNVLYLSKSVDKRCDGRLRETERGLAVGQVIEMPPGLVELIEDAAGTDDAG